MEVQSMAKEEIAREKGIYRVTIVGSVVNFLLLLFKFFAGIVGHSAAMLADAVHSLSDFITDIIVIVFVRISSKPEDEGHDYGHGKYETLATAIIGIFFRDCSASRKQFAAKIYFVCSPLQIPHSQTTPPPPLQGRQIPYNIVLAVLRFTPALAGAANTRFRFLISHFSFLIELTPCTLFLYNWQHEANRTYN